MASREDRERIRPDLVRGVAVGGDPIGADEDDVDLAAAHQVPGGDIRDQRVGYAGLSKLPGREPRALEVGPRLVDPDGQLAPGVVGRLDDPERGPELAARERSRVAVGQDPKRPEVLHGQGRQAEIGKPPVVDRGLADDRVGLGTKAGGDRRSVLGQIADGLEPGHHPVDRPAEVDRRRPGRPESRSAAAENRPAGVRLGVLRPLGRQGEPDRRDLSDRRRAANDHLANGGRGLGRVSDVDLDELIGQPALVDEVEDCIAFAKRRPEAGRGAAVRLRRADRLDEGLQPGRGRHRIEDCAGRLGRRALERLGGTRDGRRGLEQLAGELTEEAAPGEVCGPVTWAGDGFGRAGDGVERAGRMTFRPSRIAGHPGWIAGRHWLDDGRGVIAGRGRRRGGFADRVGQCALARERVGMSPRATEPASTLST